MKKQITFRHMDHSKAIEAHVNEQLEKIEKFLENERDPVSIHIALEAGRTHAHHRVDIQVKSPNYDLYCDYEGPDMHDVINRVLDTMYRLLTEEKKKRIDQRKAPKPDFE